MMEDYLSKFSLEGKVAFVCGGAGLIGSEVAQALAGAGAKTIILDNNSAAARELATKISESGYTAHYENFDVTKLELAEQKLTALMKKYKGLDVWVNLSYPRTKDWGAAVENLNLKTFRQNVDMHLNSYAWLSRCAALLMKKNKIAGSIINFASIYGLGANDFTVYEGTSMTSPMAYGMIKAGIINVTRYLASYFGKYNIRCNTICPGGIFDNQNPRFVKNYSKKTPLKRMGKPQEMAGAVIYLVSDASSYVTGHALVIDGGWTIV